MADHPALLILDFTCRGGAIALLLLLAALFARDRRDRLPARLAGVFALGVAAYAICSAPGIAPLRTWWHAPLLALASGNAVVFWLFARAVFDDGFAVRYRHGALWLAFAAGALVQFYMFDPAASATGRAFGLALALGRIAFAALAAAQTLATWRADLLEGRRRFRIFSVGAIGIFILLNAASDLFGATLAGVSLANAAGLLAMTLAIGWPLLRIAGDDLFGVASAVPTSAVTPAERGDSSSGGLDAADRRLLDALQRLMSTERIYRREGLTIGALALKLGLPEYRLRRLINQGLGFRNFNAFLNSYRIAEVRRALADPTQAEVPVLTVALDAGFQSLGPFNRAFRAETGMTPSDYRRLRRSDAGAKPLSARDDFEISKPA